MAGCENGRRMLPNACWGKRVSRARRLSAMIDGLTRLAVAFDIAMHLHESTLSSCIPDNRRGGPLPRLDDRARLRRRLRVRSVTLGSARRGCPAMRRSCGRPADTPPGAPPARARSTKKLLPASLLLLDAGEDFRVDRPVGKLHRLLRRHRLHQER